MNDTIEKALNKIMYVHKDKYSKNNTGCPHCGSDKILKVGRDKFRDEDKYQCITCKKRHTISNL